MLFLVLLSLSIHLRSATALLSTGVIFPLYFFPNVNFNDNCTAWQPVISAISANPTLPFLFIVNPASGPGSANSQPDPAYQGCIPQLANHANVRIIGYVSTVFGNRDVTAVVTDIATYAQWSAPYRPTGIFFDETNATSPLESQYQSYATAVHQDLGSSAFATFNPGVNPPDTNFYTFADLIVSVENFFASFNPSQLVISGASPAQKQAVILHDGPTTTSVDLVKQLVALNLGYLFFTDFTHDNSEDYKHVPTDWANFCSVVASAQS
ncbi:Spherulation-specific family 4 [Mycena floridula]|nr:Spherulation-specific family 4 [Mycena floridula]